MPAPPASERAAPSNTMSNVLLIGGGVALAAGGVSHLLMWRARVKLNEAETQDQYDPYSADFDRYRVAAITLYIVGAGAAVTGYVIRKKYSAEAPTVSAMPLPEGGGFVSVGWAR